MKNDCENIIIIYFKIQIEGGIFAASFFSGLSRVREERNYYSTKI